MPIVMRTALPPPRGRICALTVDPARLMELRWTRHERLGRATGDRVGTNSVRREVEYALSIFRGQRGWPVVGATGRPIEEVATETMALVGRLSAE